MRVAVVGASGYTGLELVRIVLRHPHFELVAVTSEQRAGVPAGDAFPSLRGNRTGRPLGLPVFFCHPGEIQS